MRIYRDTADPLNASKEDRPFQNASETTLRSSPMESDTYDPNASGREGHAVFGNVVSKYLAGASGQILFTQKAEDQTVWAYVNMGEESNPLRYYVGYDVNVGWTKLHSDIKK